MTASKGRHDRRGPQDHRVRALQQATHRLDGHWDDGTAWRILGEEWVRAWCEEPGVVWALIGPRAVPGRAVSDQGVADRAVWCVAGEPAAVWGESPLTAELWDALDRTAGRPLGPAAPATLIRPFPPAAVAPTGHGWLATAVLDSGRPSLALVVGLARPVADVVADDPLGLALVDDALMLAPLLGQRRRMIELAGENANVRSECDTLTRLGDLRTRLAAVTAHELKTPLTSITAYAEVLEQRIADPAFTYGPDFLRVIRSEADRLLRLVDRLLDSTRRGRGQALDDPRPVAVADLVGAVERALSPQATARGLHLVARIPADLPAIEGDDDLVRQILVNLVGNAIKFTPPGGRVVISAREDTSMVRLAVSDNGRGIAPRDLRSIFQSFYRPSSARQVEGLGLGLSIVKEITNLHGGHLDVSSRLGQGTTFAVFLPKVQTLRDASELVGSADLQTQDWPRAASLCLRLVAELAVARGVLLALPVDGDLLPLAVMGMPPAAMDLDGATRAGFRHAVVDGPQLIPWPPYDAEHGTAAVPEPGTAMIAPLRLADRDEPGVLVVAHRCGGGLFGEDDLTLLQVLAEVVARAWSALLASGGDRDQRDRVIEAMAMLAGLRRIGVPTTDPQTMRLIARTGRRLGLSSYEIRLLQYAGALHDAGMLMLDPEVLHKPALLDTDERDHVGAHPQRGIDLLGPLVDMPELRQIIRHHHERVDGLGYPDGRRGDEIPLGARILAVVDAFFAMIHSRPWRDGLSLADAVGELQRHAGSQFDPDVVAAFVSVLTEEGLQDDERATGRLDHDPIESSSGR